MKKLATIALVSLLSLSLLTACGKPADSPSNATPEGPKVIKVGASPAPHAEILKAATPELEKLGYTLEVVEFSDYVQPNLTLQSDDLQANFFQHKPYMDDFNEKNKGTLTSAAGIHFEPFAIYGGKTKSLSDLPDGAIIGVPNDTTNEARALQLLEAQGLIKLKSGVGLMATAKDIVENPKNLVLKEVEAAALPRLLPDVDLAVINGNYAIEAGLSLSDDALATEDKDSEAAQTFTNILAVKEGNQDSESIQALVKALHSETVKTFIEDKYAGAVIPVF